MPGREVHFQIDKTIYIQDAPSDEEAIQKAAEQLMDKLNQDVVAQAKVSVETIKADENSANAPPVIYNEEERKRIEKDNELIAWSGKDAGS